ncbi:MAG: radical SAM protein [Candidatus Omnitrophota bacterium]|jgi:radical SAM superfamily enzyme YgiQ (UPF0313 family)
MKSVILIYPSDRFGGAVQPRIELPLAMLTIATPLDRAGYRVKIIDQRLDRHWKINLQEELNKDPICVGISSMTGPQIRNGLEASQFVKQSSDIPVVWGGIHPTLLPEQTARNENIDIVVQGEGEETFFELVRALENKTALDKIRGIWYKQGNEIKHTALRPLIDLNMQPVLSYHLVDMKKYQVGVFGKGHISLETSRGCPLRCNYCYNTRVFNSSWRCLSVDETMRRIKILVNDYGIKGFLFPDDNFFGSGKERGMSIIKRIKDEKINILISKLDSHLPLLSRLTDDELRLLKQAGLTMLMIGVESGSPGMLKMMNKELNIPELIRFNKRLAQFNIMTLYFFMMGYPTETINDLRQTISLYLQLIRENKWAVSHVNIYTPFPGTGMFDISVKHGLKVPEKLEDWVPFNYHTVIDNAPWLTEERKKILQMLHFATLLSEKNNFIRPYKKTNPWIVFLANLYHPIAKKRVEHLYYKFPIEIKLAEWLGLYPKQK